MALLIVSIRPMNRRTSASLPLRQHQQPNQEVWFHQPEIVSCGNLLSSSLPGCTNTSETYQSFTLTSPLISTVSSPQIDKFSNNPEISISRPLTLEKNKYVEIDVIFASSTQAMEIYLTATKEISKFTARTKDSNPLIAGTLVSTSVDSVTYVLTVVPPSTQSTMKLSLVIYSSKSGSTSITSLIIKACTGNYCSTTCRNPFSSRCV